MEEYGLKYKTKEEFYTELGFSRSTFYRRLREIKAKMSGRLISPKEQNRLRLLLGFPPLEGF